ncbi:MAG: Cof-type HAD-IIB family hydrolase [Acidobacteriota bacterium]|nr:Cof-type HAD-IIB family hydrolase [Acidobacteriota bacterium]
MSWSTIPVSHDGTTHPPSSGDSFPVRLVAIDIDGTLLDTAGRVPDANRQAIHAAVTRGVEVVLATGRSFHHARPIADRVGAKVVLIVSNGALVKTADGVTLDQCSLPRHLVRDLIIDTRNVRQGAALIFDRADATQYMWERIDWSHPQRQWYYDRNRQYMTRTDALETALDEEPIQLAFTGGVDEMRQLHANIRALPSARDLTLTLTEYEQRDFSLLDITASGCSKGSSVAAWASRRGIPTASVMAVGDNLNDLEMLKRAGYPVVMGNAVPELKRFGWPVTGPHDEAGLAQAIESQVLVTSG